MIYNSITSVLLLKAIQQEVCPLSILSTSTSLYSGFKQGSYSSRIQVKIPDFDAQILYVYDEPLQFISALILNLRYLDPSKIMKSDNEFDDQHDKLDGIFQGIRILNNIPNPESFIVKASAYLQARIIAFLTECSRRDPYHDYIFYNVLSEIKRGEWRSNIYFDKLY